MKLYPSDPDIETIVGRIKSGRLNLQPDFQRGEVWNIAKKRRLIDSILRGWHIPPVHIVDTGSSSLEVLDGQQRLAAIRDFTQNNFKIDGNIDPIDENIKKLDGLTFDELTLDMKNTINEFQLRVFTIKEYLPSEPAELFHRLNQLTNLTPAEQRNAYYGKAREQVKNLVMLLSKVEKLDAKIGFSNSRMNYDEVIARFLVYIENKTLGIKVTSNELTNYYRKEGGFSKETIENAHKAIDLMIDLLDKSEEKFKFNKATFLSWLLFIHKCIINKYEFILPIENLKNLIISFEKSRKSDSYFNISVEDTKEKLEHEIVLRDFFKIYNDRSTSRVADVSSVQLRDYILFIYTFTYFDKLDLHTIPFEYSIFNDSSNKNKPLEEILLESITSSKWGDY